MSSVFIKRYPSKGEFPEYGQRVVGLVLEQGDLGLSKFLWNVSYNDDTKIFKMDGGFSVNIEYWLEEIELPSKDDIRDNLLEQGSIANYALYQSGHEDGANFILNKLKGGVSENLQS